MEGLGDRLLAAVACSMLLVTSGAMGILQVVAAEGFAGRFLAAASSVLRVPSAAVSILPAGPIQLARLPAEEAAPQDRVATESLADRLSAAAGALPVEVVAGAGVVHRS